jgi:hypothetical protein
MTKINLIISGFSVSKSVHLFIFFFGMTMLAMNEDNNNKNQPAQNTVNNAKTSRKRKLDFITTESKEFIQKIFDEDKEAVTQIKNEYYGLLFRLDQASSKQPATTIPGRPKKFKNKKS